MEEYYLPHQIRFTRDDIMWCLPFLENMKEGHWPPNPHITGYTDAPLSQKSISSHASFENPTQIAAEIEARLDYVGRDGIMIVAYYCYGWTEKRIVQLCGLKENQVYRRIKDALNYISSGKCRRWMSCDNCTQKCRKRGRLPVSYDNWINHEKSPTIVRNIGEKTLTT